MRLSGQGAHVDPNEADAFIDLWWTYIHRHIETSANWVNLAAHMLIDDQPRRAAIQAEISHWTGEVKGTLARGRQEVAHGNTIYVRGIDEEGLWEPMLALGIVGPEAVDEMIRPRAEAFINRLQLWDEGMRAVTASAIGYADSICERVAKS